MASNQKKVQEKTLRLSVLILFITAVVFMVVKEFQLLSFYDEASGMLRPNTIQTVLEWTIIAGGILLALLSVRVSLLMDKVKRYYEKETFPIQGIGLFIAGIFGTIDGFSSLFGSSSSNFLTILTDLFCILSGFSFLLSGILLLKQKKSPPLFLVFVPICWGILLAVDILLTGPEVVSMQEAWVKSFASALTVWFLYFAARQSSENAPPSVIASSVLLYFPVMAMLFAAPYILAQMAGVKDVLTNMPYLAVVGVMFYAFTLMLSMLKNSIRAVRRQHRTERSQMIEHRIEEETNGE